MGMRRISAVGAAAALAASGIALTASPAFARAQTSHEHDSFPAAGSVFTCQGGDLTATSGVVDEVMMGTLDAQGVFHFTGTITPHDVTLVDAAGNTYTLSGASWFGGKGTGLNEPPILSTETDHFVIHTASGGVYAQVQLVGHMSPNGTMFLFDRGTCEVPND